MTNDPYSKGYVAAGPIEIDGGPAFNTGDPVPDSHVSRGVVSRDNVIANQAKADEKPSGGARGVRAVEKADAAES